MKQVDALKKIDKKDVIDAIETSFADRLCYQSKPSELTYIVDNFIQSLKSEIILNYTMDNIIIRDIEKLIKVAKEDSIQNCNDSHIYFMANTKELLKKHDYDFFYDGNYYNVKIKKSHLRSTFWVRKMVYYYLEHKHNYIIN